MAFHGTVVWISGLRLDSSLLNLSPGRSGRWGFFQRPGAILKHLMFSDGHEEFRQDALQGP